MNSPDLLAKALFEADINFEPAPEKENVIQDVMKPLPRIPTLIHSSVFAKQGPSNEKIQFHEKAPDLLPTTMNLPNIVPEDVSKIRTGTKQMPESFEIRQPILLVSGGLSKLPTPSGKTFRNVSPPCVLLNRPSMRPEDIYRAKSENKSMTKPISSKPIVVCNPLFTNQKSSNGTIQFHIKTQDLLSKALNLSDITLEDVPDITNDVEVVPKHFVIQNPLPSASKGVSNLPEPNARRPSIVKPNDSLSMACNGSDLHTKSVNLVQPSEKEGTLKPFLVQSSKANPKQESVNLHIPNVRYSLGTPMKLKPVLAVSRDSRSPQVLKIAVPGKPSQDMNNSTMMPVTVMKNEANGPYYHNGNAPAFTSGRVPLPAVEEHIDEEDELGLAETYADYMPSKLKLGERHPDPVVESSSLSSVPPPDIWYRLCISEDITDSGLLSALQLEAITYACQQHETILPDGKRAGFLIGDGAGVGKGRTLAGIIYENYLLGRKRAIWFSVSSDLKYDAERDFSDINANEIKVYSLNKFKYAKVSSKLNGKVKRGVIFATYSSLIGESQAEGKYNTRLKQLLQWCGDDFDGCIVFDECHKAKNLCPVGSTKPTKTGLTVLDLQNKLPKARIVYASATGASEPKNMAYMTRLGLWGEGMPFKEFSEFISVVEKRGVGAMELVAMDMKLRGLYMARQLSFAGVSFKIEEIPLSECFRDMYNQSVNLWVDAHGKFEMAAELMRGDAAIKRTMWCQFWASHQKFFKYLCIASKVSHVVHLAREAVKNGKCVVIGLQSTGEAQMSEQLEEQGGELNDFVSTAKSVFQSLIEKQFPAPDRKKTTRLLGLELSNMIDSDQGGCTSSVTTTPCGSKRKRVEFESGAMYHKESRFSDESSFEESADDEDNFSESDAFSENSSCEERKSTSVDQNSDSDDCSFFWKGFSKFAENPRKLKKKKVKERKKRKKGLHKSRVNKAPEKFPQVVDATEKAAQLKQELLQKLDKLENLPVNTLDQLIADLGGPDCVAEMTGRKGRVVSNCGAIQYEVRSENDVPLEVLNLTEKRRFMDGEKNIAIISEAASSGISLHSDRRVRNQARRVHMTLELPWSADRAIQQFGRTHRSNQVNAPEYVFLISNLAGERRFASVVAKRLESLGALTHGDRRATESRDLSMFNFDTKYGRSALDRTIEAVMEHEKPMVPPPMDYQGHFFLDVRNALCGVSILGFHPDLHTPFIEKGFKMTKFLNRILGVPVGLQNSLFKYFTDTLDAIIQRAKKSGRYDMGILDLGAGDSHVKRIKCNSFIRRHATGTAKTELHTVLVERGLSWEDAVKKCKLLMNKDEGFYVSVQTRNNHRTSILAVLDVQRTRLAKKDNEKFFKIYRPNTGLQAKQETLTDLKSKYGKSSIAETETYWKDNFHHSKDLCSHVYWYGHCRKRAMNLDCEIGLRQRTFHVLSGSVLSLWTTVEKVISSITSGTQNAKLQVVRLRTDGKNNTRIVGCLIPNIAVPSLVCKLSEDSNDVFKQEFG